MKSSDIAVRLAEFKARIVEDLDFTIANLDQAIRDLDAQIHDEEHQTGIEDPTHSSYSLLAKSIRSRRDNLQASSKALRRELSAAIAERDQTVARLMRKVVTEPRKDCRKRGSKQTSDDTKRIQGSAS